MTDNKTTYGFAAWLPVASLALSAAAFGMGAPARLARSLHRPASIASSKAPETVLNDESAIFPMPASLRLERTGSSLPAGAWRGIHEVLGRQFTASR